MIARLRCRLFGHSESVTLSPNVRACHRCGLVQVRGFAGRLELFALSRGWEPDAHG